MTDFNELVSLRRSHRKFTEQPIDGDALSLILRAGLMSPTSRARRAWHFIVVEDKLDLEKLSEAKSFGAAFLKDAPLAVVMCADINETDCWIEDCSIAAVTMQYQAEELGLGSCWIQYDKRGLTDGIMSNEIINGILDIPENQRVLCAIAFGYPATELPRQDEDSLKWENVHIGKFKSHD